MASFTYLLGLACTASTNMYRCRYPAIITKKLMSVIGKVFTEEELLLLLAVVDTR